MSKLKTLLLKLAGPLQSWGVSSDFETRYTDLYPSKSAVIGMIAGSLGYRRHEGGKINQLNSLDFAARIDQVGNLLRDFHIAKSYKQGGDLLRTYVTNRYYVEDAVFVVAIGSEDHVLIESISLAVQKPYFQTFMGRKSLPLNSDFYLNLVEDNVISALEKYPWQASEWYQKAHKAITSLDIYADSKLLPKKRKYIRRDKVVSFNQKSREFDYRYESMEKVHGIKRDFFEEEHDAFAALGD